MMPKHTREEKNENPIVGGKKRGLFVKLEARKRGKESQMSPWMSSIFFWSEVAFLNERPDMVAHEAPIDMVC